jgi:hypothetical protein
LCAGIWNALSDPCRGPLDAVSRNGKSHSSERHGGSPTGLYVAFVGVVMRLVE